MKFYTDEKRLLTARDTTLKDNPQIQWEYFGSPLNFLADTSIYKEKTAEKQGNPKRRIQCKR